MGDSLLGSHQEHECRFSRKFLLKVGSAPCAYSLVPVELLLDMVDGGGDVLSCEVWQLGVLREKRVPVQYSIFIFI